MEMIEEVLLREVLHERRLGVDPKDPDDTSRPIADQTTGSSTIGGVGMFAEIRVDDGGPPNPPRSPGSALRTVLGAEEHGRDLDGLTVARHAIRNLGGEVTVVNRAGGGASSCAIR